MKTSNKKRTGFVIAFIQNLGILLLIGLILFIIFPDIMSQVFQVYGLVFTPALIVILIIVAALPRKRRR